MAHVTSKVRPQIKVALGKKQKTGKSQHFHSWLFGIVLSFKILSCDSRRLPSQHSAACSPPRGKLLNISSGVSENALSSVLPLDNGAPHFGIKWTMSRVCDSLIFQGKIMFQTFLEYGEASIFNVLKEEIAPSTSLVRCDFNMIDSCLDEKAKRRYVCF